jgi:23S rRNA-/tRNA-specific pseudouridylate synthase
MTTTNTTTTTTSVVEEESLMLQEYHKWRSPLLSPIMLLVEPVEPPCGRPSTVEFTEYVRDAFTKDLPPAASTSNSNSCTIPESGWYGLCFTTREEEDPQEAVIRNTQNQKTETVQSTVDEERNQRRETKAGISCRTNNQQKQIPTMLSASKNNTGFRMSMMATDFECSLWIRTKGSGELSSEEITVKLSMLTDGHNNNTNNNNNNNNNTNTIATGIGKLHYLPQGCSVAVIVQGGKDAPIPVHLKWFLLYRRWISQVVDGDNTNSITSTLETTTTSITNNKRPRPGEISSAKKFIICGSCNKRFGAGRAAAHHRRRMHVALQTTTDTTTTSTACNPSAADTDKKDNISVKAPGSATSAIKMKMPDELMIVYQDSSMAIIDKPQGLAVMGATESTLCRSDLLLSLAVPPEDQEKELDDSATSRYKFKYKYLRKPVPVHRLDAATGGLLVIAKTKEAERHLKLSFETRKCQKRYRALLLGRLVVEPQSLSQLGLEEGVVDHTVDSKPAKSRYRVIRHYPSVYGTDGWVTVVDLFPETGRRHQLRKHMKLLGHPIVGDKRYGGIAQSIRSRAMQEPGGQGQHGDVSLDDAEAPHLDTLMSRLCLWAMELTLPHPVTNREMSFVLKDQDWLEHVIRHSAPTPENHGT